MAEFFTSWATWEKLVFILACAIVVTILLGCVKLVYVHWQLRKHTKAVELGDDEQVIRRQMSQRRRAQRIKNEVPFGIRAIEEGIEVEGVWISRTNTPEPLSRESSGASLIPKSNQPAPDETVSGHDNSTETGILVEDIDDDHRSRHQSLEAQARLESQSGSIPTREIISPSFISRVRTPFFTSTRYSSVSQSPRTSSGTSGVRRLSRFSGIPAYTHVWRSSEVSDERQQRDGVHSADSTASSNEVIAASEPPETSHKVSFAQHNPTNLEFELMQSHRRSQAAEMGQLLPRSRRPASKDCSDRLRDSARSSYEVPPLLHVEIPDPRLSASLTSDMKHNTPSIETETRSSAQILDPAVNGHAASENIFTEVRIVASDGRDFPMT
ncbi:uncharacterized protein K489DRAFT_116334 [Dissoconium aciculare CBS 342.82]|uniref:Uncharacterized protein n=1 Tax=Dissoconium aciculare CBS 342.82 TaxID=1314786 RepID=A0A6J3MFM3_9PEZI|nr:uncharacterized protein K489DRAFT_116334 [Dissoconium aciculare CBS 342.82]KAF1826454.1 hypothetical protein K489DRAFT_116334 [Dissoconium aciculare CBS 342.82]